MSGALVFVAAVYDRRILPAQRVFSIEPATVTDRRYKDELDCGLDVWTVIA